MSHQTAKTLKIALAQYDPTVGDIAGNVAKMRQARGTAQRLGADLVVMSELFLVGYPPEDLVLKPAFTDACRSAAEAFAKETVDGGPAILFGTVWPEHDDGEPKVYNSVVLADAGKIVGIRFKNDLPNYGVFDEKRVFAAGPLPGPILFRGVKLGVPICEDIWKDEVVECLAA